MIDQFDRQPGSGGGQRAFTMIELLVVIAIIAILAALLFPAFAAVREQTHQSTTISNMHSVYVGARLFFEDEGHYPDTLFPYAEKGASPAGTVPPAIVAQPGDTPVPMNQATGYYATAEDQTGKATQSNRGFLYGEQVKDFNVFINVDNPVKDKQATAMPIYPAGTPFAGLPVVWDPVPSNQNMPPCRGSYDNAAPAGFTAGTQKVYYAMDSMDVGPQLNAQGKPTGAYELHYSPDWTHQLGTAYTASGGATCPGDVDPTGKDGPYLVTQLKYQNPPSERTVLTYVTHHAASANASDVIVLLLSGTARKVDYHLAVDGTLPLYYKP